MKNTFVGNFLTGNTSVTLFNASIHTIVLLAVFAKFLFMSDDTKKFYDNPYNKAYTEPQILYLL